MKLSLLLLGMLTSGLAFGGSGITLGGGPNISWLNYELPEGSRIDIDQSPRLGYNIGAELELQVTRKSSLVSGAWYETRGATWEATATGSFQGIPLSDETELGIKYSYIVVPVLYKRRFFAEGLSPYFSLGVEVGFLSTAEVEGEEDLDVKDESGKIDLLLTAHLGYEVPHLGNAILFDVGYDYGMMALDDVNSSGDEKYNRNIKISARYKYVFFK